MERHKFVAALSERRPAVTDRRYNKIRMKITSLRIGRGKRALAG